MIIIDADSIVYRVGFPSDGKKYLVVGYDSNGDPQAHQAFRYKKDADKFAATFADADFEFVMNPDPVEHVLHSVKQVMSRIVGICHKFGPDHEVLLSGPGNFREELATIKKYKGNRSKEAPYHYFNIRHYLADEWGATVVEGREADDQCCISAGHYPEGTVVIVSIDKDLDMIPGWHFNWVRETFYHVSQMEGTKHFYKQLLMGDATDNIGGVHKIGKSSKTLDRVEEMHTEEEMYTFVRKEYVASLKKDECPYVGMDIDEVILENARLLWMQQAPGQLWTPPGRPHEYEETFE